MSCNTVVYFEEIASSKSGRISKRGNVILECWQIAVIARLWVSGSISIVGVGAFITNLV